MDKTTSLVVDIDGTLCDLKTAEQTYLDVAPKPSMIAQLRQYQEMGYRIILFTSRQMRTYQGNLGEINKYTAPITEKWLAKYDVPYDEILFGKPWAGHGGYYIDDRAIRPSEFLKYSEAEIAEIVAKERDVH